MTLDDAVKVLNRDKFSGVDSWRIDADDEGEDAVVGSVWAMTPFVTIAVAKELERKAKPETMTAADWFGCLIEANDIGDANAASFALAELRALGWEIKATDGTWGDRRSMPATREIIAVLAVDARKSYEDNDVWFSGFAGNITYGDIREADAEWSDQPNPSTETDA